MKSEVVSVSTSELREALRPFKKKSNLLGLSMFAADALLFVLLTAIAAWHRSIPVRLLAGGIDGLAIGFLFVLGHEAAHGSLLEGRHWNRWIGRLSFLTTATPLSSWELVHNCTHHVYTNLATKDYVWSPLSLTQYRALTGWSRALQRLYRSPWGLGFYYPIEIWWKRLFFPPRALTGRARRKYGLDSLLCLAWLIVLWATVARAGWAAVFTAMVWPQIVWSWLIGWALFDQHTHPRVPWFDDEAEWRESQPQTRSSVHIALPAPVDFVLHHVFHHTAHHLDMTIPIYRLADAQRAVEQRCPHIVVNRWTLRGFLQNLRICKLYDFQRHVWMDFEGRPASVQWRAD